MTQKKIRINLEDSEGAKFRFDIEGNVTREKVLKLFELMDIMNLEDEQNTPDLETLGGKIWYIIENYFPAGKFTSSAVLEKYEDEYNEPDAVYHQRKKQPIKLSVISTYLARFYSQNKIMRTRTGREWSYQVTRLAQKQQTN
jgi:hypothetical protein|tara:strand:+ start:56 stop:481 length:426 start_codon:yes stop_codon:yes gene_type:complete